LERLIIFRETRKGKADGHQLHASTKKAWLNMREEEKYFSASSVLYSKKGKAVPLYTMEALGGRGGIAPTPSRPRH
jgi:hypothetical protein